MWKTLDFHGFSGSWWSLYSLIGAGTLFQKIDSWKLYESADLRNQVFLVHFQLMILTCQHLLRSSLVPWFSPHQLLTWSPLRSPQREEESAAHVSDWNIPRSKWDVRVTFVSKPPGAPAQVPISGSVVGDDGKKNIGNLRRDTPWETSQSNVP